MTAVCNCMPEEASAEWLTKLQDEFNKHWEGKQIRPMELSLSGKNTTGSHRSGDETIRAAGGWAKAGKSEKELEEEFHTPVETTLFNWTAPNRELDTLISPYDSIRYVKKHSIRGSWQLIRHRVRSRPGWGGHALLPAGSCEFQYQKDRSVPPSNLLFIRQPLLIKVSAPVRNYLTCRSPLKKAADGGCRKTGPSRTAMAGTRRYADPVNGTR